MRLLFDVDGCLRIPNEWAHEIILNKHYARRLPSISFAFGWFRSGELDGVCTFGRPSSAKLRAGVCGEEWVESVWELNRLYLSSNIKMDASRFVSRCLKAIPKPSIVVSFADPSHGHEGTVYKACNFIYCGLSEKRTDWKVRGMEHLHGQTIADQFKGSGRAQAMRDKYGDDFYLEDRPRKHRYIYFVGSKGDRRKMQKALKYKEVDYVSG